MFAGLVIGIISSVPVCRQGLAGFTAAQAWSLLIVCGLAAIFSGIPYLMADKPPILDGRRVELQFKLRVPATFKIPDERTVTASESLFMVTINPSML
jgi:hypothetical protein